MNSLFFKLPIRIVLFISFFVVTLHAYPPEFDSLVARKVVNNLSIERFKSDIEELSEMGDRLYGSSSNAEAGLWLQSTLSEIGYAVTIQSTYKNVICTKVSSVSPDSGYVIGAHFDGRGGGGAADDDASGTSLIIEAARAFFAPNLKTHYSIRFVLFNCEETGISGSNAYVRDRQSLQGKEDPVGSGQYPEPLWLGMIAHDMILYDHGVPWQQDQIPDADIDVEYLSGTIMAQISLELANLLVDGCEAYSADYPAEVGTKMTLTDSDPFKRLTAAVSVRENRRADEIGNNSNPNYHQPTDKYERYSELDFLLGFNTVQTTVGTICRLAGVYDSSVTANSQAMGGGSIKKALFSSITTGVKIFSARGRKIAELDGVVDWRQLFKHVTTRSLLSRGMYILQVNNGSHTTTYKFLY